MPDTDIAAVVARVRQVLMRLNHNKTINDAESIDLLQTCDAVERLTEDISVGMVELYRSRCQELTADRDRLRDSVERLTAENDYLRRTKNEAVGEMDKARCEVERLTVELDVARTPEVGNIQLQSQCMSLQADRDRLKAEVERQKWRETASEIRGFLDLAGCGRKGGNTIWAMVKEIIADRDRLRKVIADQVAKCPTCGGGGVGMFPPYTEGQAAKTRDCPYCGPSRKAMEEQ